MVWKCCVFNRVHIRRANLPFAMLHFKCCSFFKLACLSATPYYEGRLQPVQCSCPAGDIQIDIVEE